MSGAECGEARELAWRFTVRGLFLDLYFIGERFVIAHINPSGLFAEGEKLLSAAFLCGVAAWVALIGCFLFIEPVLGTLKIVGPVWTPICCVSPRGLPLSARRQAR